ncbi:MAG: hypothetical protein GY822_20935 [Deltaproteobacteria bacterium]|nr:hypothetical protein [Deltaproteobacteria bacterium]
MSSRKRRPPGVFSCGSPRSTRRASVGFLFAWTPTCAPFFRALPLDRPFLLVGLVVLCTVASLPFHFFLSNRLDRVAHDAVMVQGARTSRTKTTLVVLDDKLPSDVASIQLLPLLANVVARLVDLGAEAVYLDGALLAHPDPLLPYALCLEEHANGLRTRMARPSCGALVRVVGQKKKKKKKKGTGTMTTST